MSLRNGSGLSATDNRAQLYSAHSDVGIYSWNASLQISVCDVRLRLRLVTYFSILLPMQVITVTAKLGFKRKCKRFVAYASRSTFCLLFLLFLRLRSFLQVQILSLMPLGFFFRFIFSSFFISFAFFTSYHFSFLFFSVVFLVLLFPYAISVEACSTSWPSSQYSTHVCIRSGLLLPILLCWAKYSTSLYSSVFLFTE